MHSMSFTDPGSSPSGASAEAVVRGAVSTDTEVRGFVLGLVFGILAGVGVALGAVFLVIGLAVDAGSPNEVMKPIGGAFLAAGLLCAALAFLGARRGRRRTAAERAARVSSATVVIVEARLRLGSRVGALHPLRLAVRYADGTDATRTLYVPPTTEAHAGQRLAVRHDPSDPRNFVPAGAR